MGSNPNHSEVGCLCWPFLLLPAAKYSSVHHHFGFKKAAKICLIATTKTQLGLAFVRRKDERLRIGQRTRMMRQLLNENTKGCCTESKQNRAWNFHFNETRSDATRARHQKILRLGVLQSKVEPPGGATWNEFGTEAISQAKSPARFNHNAKQCQQDTAHVTNTAKTEAHLKR